MAKKDELEFEGGIENAPKPNNSEKLWLDMTYVE